MKIPDWLKDGGNLTDAGWQSINPDKIIKIKRKSASNSPDSTAMLC
jgi:hypothetical protein